MMRNEDGTAWQESVFLKKTERVYVVLAMNEGTASAQSRPSSAKIMTTMRISPTIPDGPYPQDRLCPHVGKTPSKIRTRIMIRIVPSDIIVSPLSFW
jgi:hypothetical protein